MIDTETYRREWENHIDELTRLGWFLSAEDIDRVEDLQDDLREVLDVACENKDRQERDGVADAENLTVEKYRNWVGED